ncbi:MAG: hypothetical protein NWQ46_03050 [Spirosomaceae bacterium]|nr:hypothetical protein [Spirosomataceae bacterium]
MLTKSIYVSGVNNLSDARYCSGMGVEFIGVSMDEHDPNYLPVEKFNEINGWLVGINWIAESSDSNAESLIEKCEIYGLKRIAIANDLLAEQLIVAGFEVLLKVEEVLTSVISSPNIIGYEIIFSEKLLDELENGLYNDNTSLYLGGEISIENLEKINEIESVKGVVISGGEEERPGYKDMDGLIDAIEVFED